MNDSFVLRCLKCEHDEPCGPSLMLDRLRQCGMLKREKDTELGLVRELFESQVDQFCCSDCGHRGLVLATSGDSDEEDWDEEDWDDEEWGQARCCDQCREPIDPARLEVFPDMRLCVKCQRSDEEGSQEEEREFCPRCGSVMEMRSRSIDGLTRYVMFCSACRHTVR